MFDVFPQVLLAFVIFVMFFPSVLLVLRFVGCFSVGFASCCYVFVDLPYVLLVFAMCLMSFPWF